MSAAEMPSEAADPPLGRDPPPPGRPPRRRRARRWLFILLLGPLALILAAVAVALVVAQTQFGRNQIVAFAESAAPGLEIEGLEGFVPFDMRIARVAMAGPDEPWLVVEDAEVRWAFWPLVRRRLVVEALTAGRVVVGTPPPAEEEPPSDEPFQWPRLPIRIAIERLAVDDLSLTSLDPPARLAIEAAGDLGNLAEGVDLHLSAQRLDGAEGTLEADLRLASEVDAGADIRFREGEGGIVAQLLGLPGAPPVAVEVTTRREGEDYSVTVAGSAGDGITIDGDLHLASGRELGGRVVLEAEGAALPALPEVALEHATVEVGLGGTLETPRGTLDLTIRRLDAPTVAAETARVSVEAEAGEGLETAALQVAAALEGARFDDPSIATAVGPEPALDVSGVVGLADGLLTVEQAEARVAAGRATVQGRAEAWGTGSADATVGIRIADLALLPWAAPASGPLSADVELTRRDGRLQASLAADAGEPLAAVDGLPPAADGRVTLAGGIGWADGILELSEVLLTLPGGRLAANGSVDPAEGVDLTLDLEIGDLAGLGGPVSGAATASATVSGPFDRLAVDLTTEIPRLEGAGVPVEGVRLRVETGNLASFDGEVLLEARVLDQPVRLAVTGGFDAAAGRASLPSLSLAFGELDLEGDADIRLDPLQVTAALRGETGPLEALTAAFGSPAVGAGELSLRVDTLDSGAVEAEAVFTTDDLAVADAARLRGARVVARVPDLLAGPEPTVELAVANLTAGGQALGRLDGEVTMRGSIVDVTASLAGPIADLDVGAEVDLAADPLAITLRSLVATYQDVTARLASPATITLRDGGVALSETTFGIDGGTLTVAGGAGETLDLRVRGSGLPAGTLAALGGVEDVGGQLGLDATITGRADAPRVEGTVTASGLALREAREAGFSGFGVDLDVGYDGSAVSAEGRVISPEAGGLDVSFAAPVDMSQIEASAQGRINANALNPLLAASGDRVSGTLDVDLAVRGPLDAPVPSGSVVLSGGSYANALHGVSLQDIGLRLTAEENAFTLSDLTATAENGGTLGGSGRLTLDGMVPGALDVTLTASNARVVDLPIATAAVDADINVSGDLGTGLRATGTVTAREVHIDIAASPPASLPTLEVEEVNVPPELEAQIPHRPGGGQGGGQGAVPIELDIAVDAANTIRFTGRGLRAYLGGRVRLRGTPDRPVLTGSFELDSGDFDFLGQRLEFTEGSLTFLGGWPVNPSIRFVSETQAVDVLARVGIEGTLNNPQLLVESEPPLPDDEVLARVLFGRAASELTTAEALRLANALAELSGIGGTGSTLTDIQDALGLDRLDVGMDAEGNATVTAGEQVNDRVFVGVEQGTQSGTRAKVEVEITDNIRLEGEVGSDAASQVGIVFEWEY